MWAKHNILWYFINHMKTEELCFGQTVSGSVCESVRIIILQRSEQWPWPHYKRVFSEQVSRQQRGSERIGWSFINKQIIYTDAASAWNWRSFLWACYSHLQAWFKCRWKLFLAELHFKTLNCHFSVANAWYLWGLLILCAVKWSHKSISV